MGGGGVYIRRLLENGTAAAAVQLDMFDRVEEEEEDQALPSGQSLLEEKEKVPVSFTRFLFPSNISGVGAASSFSLLKGNARNRVMMNGRKATGRYTSETVPRDRSAEDHHSAGRPPRWHLACETADDPVEKGRKSR